MDTHTNVEIQHSRTDGDEQVFACFVYAPFNRLVWVRCPRGWFSREGSINELKGKARALAAGGGG